jgi:formylglycine-generating enzyme required for sulfatase activity
LAWKIFISYRRDDNASTTARVYDGLAAAFGKVNLFMDVDNLLAGQRFDEELAKALAACHVLIAVIGVDWMELLNAKIANHERDYVREEIAEALRRRIIVVPLRVGREGKMPSLPRRQELPADIRDTVGHQRHDLTHENFERDINGLITALKAHFAAVDAALAIVPGSGQSFRDRLADGQPFPSCPEMLVVPTGTFTMGSPSNEPEREDRETQVRVHIERPFAVGKYAVTFDEWEACVAEGGCNYRPSDQGWGRGRRPVINVSWDDAKRYVQWLIAKTGKTYRMLSDAEREYVTRAGTTTPFWQGCTISAHQANFCGSYAYDNGSEVEHRGRTVPVDSFEPNPWGLYNVHGNVWEWTEDCWNESNNGNPGDGSARTIGDCSRRVLRGGSWDDYPRYLRAAYRYRYTSAIRSNFLGLRVGRALIL